MLLHFLLRSGMRAAVRVEVVQSELDGAGENVLEVWPFGNLEYKCGIGC